MRAKTCLCVKTDKKRPCSDVPFFEQTDHAFSTNFALFIKLNNVHSADRFGIGSLDLETHVGKIVEFLPIYRPSVRFAATTQQHAQVVLRLALPGGCSS